MFEFVVLTDMNRFRRQLEQTAKQRIRSRIIAAMTPLVDEIVLWMQANRVWTDRTKNARTRLKAELITSVLEYVDLEIDHGVTYGVYLETMQFGRFAILAPAARVFGQRIHDELKKVLDG